MIVRLTPGDPTVPGSKRTIYYPWDLSLLIIDLQRSVIALRSLIKYRYFYSVCVVKFFVLRILQCNSCLFFSVFWTTYYLSKDYSEFLFRFIHSDKCSLSCCPWLFLFQCRHSTLPSLFSLLFLHLHNTHSKIEIQSAIQVYIRYVFSQCLIPNFN